MFELDPRLMGLLAELAVTILSGVLGYVAMSFKAWFATKTQIQLEVISRDRIHAAAANAVRWAISQIDMADINIAAPSNPILKLGLQYMQTLMAEELAKNKLTDADVEKIIQTKIDLVLAERNAAQLVTVDAAPRTLAATTMALKNS